MPINSITVRSKKIECGGRAYNVLYMEDDYGWLLTDEEGKVLMSSFDEPQEIAAIPAGELLYQKAEDAIDNDLGHVVDWDELTDEVKKVFTEWADTDWVWAGSPPFDENGDEALVSEDE